jgi:hypothetical protein
MAGYLNGPRALVENLESAFGTQEQREQAMKVAREAPFMWDSQPKKRSRASVKAKKRKKKR